MPGLVDLVSVSFDLGDLQLFISVWQHVLLAKQPRPLGSIFACCWDVQQPTNQQQQNSLPCLPLNIYIHARTHTSACALSHTRARVHAHTYTYARSHPHIHTRARGMGGSASILLADPSALCGFYHMNYSPRSFTKEQATRARHTADLRATTIKSFNTYLCTSPLHPTPSHPVPFNHPPPPYPHFPTLPSTPSRTLFSSPLTVLPKLVEVIHPLKIFTVS